jgi:hypothetical protein
MCHTRTVSSKPAEASVCPSGAKATDVTQIRGLGMRENGSCVDALERGFDHALRLLRSVRVEEHGLSSQERSPFIIDVVGCVTRRRGRATATGRFYSVLSFPEPVFHRREIASCVFASVVFRCSS